MTYMRNNQHGEALQMLRTIILREPAGGSKVVSILQMIRCQIEIGHILAAKTTTEEVFEIFNSDVTHGLDTQTAGKCIEVMKVVVASFIQMEEMAVAVSLLRSHFNLLKSFSPPELKLRLLQDLGLEMEVISKNLFKNNETYSPNDCCVFLDDILHEMQNLFQMDASIKTRAIVSFMKHYGNCCNNFRKYSKSVDLFKQGIFFMNSIFGEYAASYQLFGHCHYHLALALEQLVKYEDAENICNDAISLYQQANDWESVHHKADSILLTSRTRENVVIKLEIYNLFWKSNISISEEERRKFSFCSVTDKKASFYIASTLLEDTLQLGENNLRRVQSVNF